MSRHRSICVYMYIYTHIPKYICMRCMVAWILLKCKCLEQKVLYFFVVWGGGGGGGGCIYQPLNYELLDLKGTLTYS